MNSGIPIDQSALPHATKLFACHGLVAHIKRDARIWSDLSEQDLRNKRSEETADRYRQRLDEDQNFLDHVSRYRRQVKKRLQVVEQYIPTSLVETAYQHLERALSVSEFDDLIQSLSAEARIHYDALVAIDNSLEKAGAILAGYAQGAFAYAESLFYEAITLFVSEINPSVVNVLLPTLRDELNASKLFIKSDAFPVDERERLLRYWTNYLAKSGTPNDLSAMRFWSFLHHVVPHHFNVKEVLVTILRQEFELSSEAVLFALRYPELSAALRGRIDFWLEDKVGSTHPPGVIVTPSPMGTPGVLFADVLSTAKLGEVLVRAGRSIEFQQKGKNIVEWLFDNQSPQGGWPRSLDPSRPVAEQELSVPTTIAALRTIAHSGAGASAEAESAKMWLASQQSPVGTWLDNSPNELEVTLEYLEVSSSLTPSSPSGQYWPSAVDFIREALVNLNDRSVVGNQVGIVLIYLGLEQALYAVISTEIPNENIYDNKGRSIGLYQAKNKAKNWLQNKATSQLKRSNIPGFAGLDRLAYFRNEIVHKGVRVQQADVQAVVEESLEFVRFLSLLPECPRII